MASRTQVQPGIPDGWADVIARTAMVAVAAGAALVFKEWMDTHEWDVKACMIDAAWVAGGAFLLNAVLMMLFPRREDNRR